MTLPNLLSDTPLPDEDKTGLQDTAQDSRPEEQASFIRDALVLVDSFSRMITGIPDLRTYITIFHDKESSIFLLKDQKLTTTTSTPIINHLIAEMMKSGSA
ncbi:MAG: hypothetical protein RML93_10975, partial [Anaerolineales bacterium]|nr:hypothetical protein [Anaerolineales bacterium]MDW8447799.1 hypothetical protein [Anaerolineales bacterium]